MRRWIARGIAVLALLPANPALTQNGFRFTSPLDVTLGRDYGFLAHDEKLTDTILVVRPPQLTFTGESPRANLTMSYQPEVQLFDRNRDLNSLEHLGTASFTFRVTERLHINASDDALVTQDPTRAIAGNLIFLPRGNFKQNMVHIAVSYAMTHKNTVSFSFDNVTASAPPDTAAPSGSGRFRNAGAISLAHAFGRTQTVTATYSLLNDYAQFLGVSYRNELARGLTVSLSTGLLKDERKNYLMSGQIEKRLGTVRVSGGYNRLLSTFGASIPGGVPIGNDLVLPVGVDRTSIYHAFSTEVSGRLSSRAGVEVGAAITKNNSGTANHDINNISVRFKFDYRIAERVILYTDVQSYTQTFNSWVGAPMDRRRCVAGIQFNLSPQLNHNSDNYTQTNPTQR